MASPTTWATLLRYAHSKMRDSAVISLKRHYDGEIRYHEIVPCFNDLFSQGQLTFASWCHNAGREMAPTIHSDGAAMLVRRLLHYPNNPTRAFVGDVVLVRHPKSPSHYLVRRLGAIGGCEMVSTDEKDEPFVLARDQCWLQLDNQSVSPKVTGDSRVFGPVPIHSICGRVIYSLRTSVDHGPVQDSRSAMEQDSPVVAVELDLQALVNIANKWLKK
ncbi:uncharacterized protein LOC120657554 isoform X2 [Panicum virgatum]|uniref:Mitochondrial inner membrane protease subunit 2 n=1 Tax=Panicum virgatum TaxID=38727 RepID=A0A8T0XHC6_PANVG|nr:uncharacterized protein LOC120657554 isoform X2 [Panicum virgatum]KAG2654819.1 hypothetical protein PVAP13_1NG498000 [Panicum virgatum]